VQGDADTTLDWRYNLPQLQRLFPRAQVYMVAGGGHHLANESQHLRSEYLGVVTNYLDT
jgi:alpha-beta hydrolase superfamily lysophospholipase